MSHSKSGQVILEKYVSGDEVSVNAYVCNGKVIFNMLTIKGIYGREVFETWHKMTAMLKSGLDISKIITAEIPYTDFEKGFEMMHSGKSGKVILDWRN